MNQTLADRRLKIVDEIPVEKLTVEYPAFKVANIVSDI